ncbi:MAG TPA: hypothetical protein VEK33_00345 [Terriglobales bacterium]|nr:hypothetical protein [Terriglobales bacterium]
MRPSADGMLDQGLGSVVRHSFLPLLIAFSLLFGALIVAGRAVRQQQYQQTYKACIVDGEKSYYCDAFAREAAR